MTAARQPVPHPRSAHLLRAFGGAAGEEVIRPRDLLYPHHLSRALQPRSVEQALANAHRGRDEDSPASLRHSVVARAPSDLHPLEPR